MKPEAVHGDWWEVDTMMGIMCYPGDYFTREDMNTQHPGIKEECITYHEDKWGARMSASGYLDATDWTLHDSRRSAMQYLRETYDDDLGD